MSENGMLGPMHHHMQAAPMMEWRAFNTCAATIPLPSPAPDATAGSAPPAYVLLNPGRYGLYRTNYSQAMWAQLAAASADPQAIPAVDLAGGPLPPSPIGRGGKGMAAGQCLPSRPSPPQVVQGRPASALCSIP